MTKKKPATEKRVRQLDLGFRLALTPGGKMCPDCGEIFVPQRPWGRFCSKKCRERYQWAARAKRIREAREGSSGQK